MVIHRHKTIMLQLFSTFASFQIFMQVFIFYYFVYYTFQYKYIELQM